MTLQQKQLDDLGEWLAKTEERIATHESLGSDLAQIREQVDEHKVRRGISAIRPKKNWFDWRNRKK